ncbi:MAG TPA: alcohol dehydrogenase [Bacteroidetes bacterium]|nr:alcohol dehydrogenase [Bacteroidota bacterium]
MKAYVISGKNKPLTETEVAEPLLKAGMVHIRMYAAALNHRDLWITKGQYAGLKYPVIPGSDIAGVVEEVGKDVPGEWVGKNAIINPSHAWGDNEAAQGKDFRILGMPDKGTLAEIVAIHREHIFPMPAHLSYVQAAALPLAGLTAWRALMQRARTQGGEKVLITGTGGGVALFALQFALALGAEVWVTSGSPDKLRSAKGLGAAGGANYRDASWAKDLRAAAGAFDVIIDGAGGTGFGDLINLAAPGGRIAVYGGTVGNYENISPQKIFWKQLSILGTTMGTTRDFHDMLRFVNKHKIVPIVDEVFPFSEVSAAFNKMESGLQFGKLVVEGIRR